MTSWPVNGNRIDSSSISVRPHRSISSQQPLIGLDECVFKLIPSAESVCVRLLAAFSDVSDGKKKCLAPPLTWPFTWRRYLSISGNFSFASRSQKWRHITRWTFLSSPPFKGFFCSCKRQLNDLWAEQHAKCQEFPHFFFVSPLYFAFNSSMDGKSERESFETWNISRIFFFLYFKFIFFGII